MELRPYAIWKRRYVSLLSTHRSLTTNCSTMLHAATSFACSLVIALVALMPRLARFRTILKASASFNSVALALRISSSVTTLCVVISATLPNRPMAYPIALELLASLSLQAAALFIVRCSWPHRSFSKQNKEPSLRT